MKVLATEPLPCARDYLTPCTSGHGVFIDSWAASDLVNKSILPPLPVLVLPEADTDGVKNTTYFLGDKACERWREKHRIRPSDYDKASVSLVTQWCGYPKGSVRKVWLPKGAAARGGPLTTLQVACYGLNCVSIQLSRENIC